MYSTITIDPGVVIFNDGVFKAAVQCYQNVASMAVTILGVFLAYVKLPFEGTEFAERPVSRMFWVCWGQLIFVMFLLTFNAILKNMDCHVIPDRVAFSLFLIAVFTIPVGTYLTHVKLRIVPMAK